MPRRKNETGESPVQARDLTPRWHKYRNDVLELFNRSFPAKKVFLESTAGPAQHHDSMFSRKPETVAVKMLVSIAGLADPEAGLDKEWNFQPGDVTSINPKRAEVWQTSARVSVARGLKALRRATLYPCGMAGPRAAALAD